MASAVVGALRVLLSADTAQFEKALKGADANVQKLANTMKRDLEPSQARINSLVRSFLGSKEIGMAESYAKAVAEIGGATRLTAADQGRVNKVVQEAIAHYKALGQQAPKHLKDLAAATKGVETPTKALGGQIDGVIGKAKALAGVFGVTLGAAAIGSFVKGVFDAADQVGDLALKMGVSTEAAQRFQFAARQSGAEIEDVSRAIVAMNKNLVDGDKSTVQALNAAGLQFADIRAKKPEDAFRAIADAIAKIPDPMLQSQVAMELFGKSGAELLPMIREESLKAADAINVMGDDTVRRLKDAKQAWENFWNGLTIISADAIVGIMNQWNKMIADLRTGAMFLLGLQAGGVSLGLQMAAGDVAARDAAAGKPMRDLQAAMAKPGLMSSHGPQAPKFRTREEIEAEERKAKDAAAAAKRLNDAYRAFERERLTGVTDAQRQAQAFEARFLSARGLTSIYALAASWVKPFNLLGQMPSTGISGQPDRLRPINFAGVGDVGFDPRIDAISRLFNLKPGATPSSLGALFKGGFGSALSMSPQVILDALTGGGNVGKAIGSLFGGNIAGSLVGKSTDGVFAGGLGKMLQDGLGNKVGGIVANLIPGIGAMLGPLLGKAFSAIAGIGQNTTKKGREGFAQQMGFSDLGGLYKQLQSMGAAGANLANLGLNVIGKKDEAANRKWMEDVQKFLEAVPKKFAALTDAVQAFGGVAPKAVQPLIDQLLKSGNLTEDMRQQLIGISGPPKWQVAAQNAAALGIDPLMLGQGFNQARIASEAFDLQHKLESLEAFNPNTADFLPGAADELSALVMEAKKAGVALPKTLEKYIRQLEAMGLLLDENGERIDMGAVEFKDIEDESLKAIVKVLEDIRDLLAGKLPDAARKFAGSLKGLGDVNIGVPKFGEEQIHMQMPSLGDGWQAYAGASYAGPGSLVGGEGTFNIYAIDAPSFEQFLKQRGGAEAVVRSMPDVIERWRGAN